MIISYNIVKQIDGKNKMAFDNDGRVALRLPVELKEKVEKHSKIHSVSKSNFIRKIVEDKINLLERFSEIKS